MLPMETSVAVCAENAGSSRAQRHATSQQARWASPALQARSPSGRGSLWSSDMAAGLVPPHWVREQGSLVTATSPGHQASPPGWGRAEYKERGKGCLLSTHKQTSHSLAPRLLGEQKVHIKLRTERLEKLCSPVQPLRCGRDLQSTSTLSSKLVDCK